MKFHTIEEIRQQGFRGFTDVGTLSRTKCDNVPAERGVYFVLMSDPSPRFRKECVGGHFKDKNPTVGIETLNSNWVNGTVVVYVGKAGSLTGRATLKSRLLQLMRFGMGEKVGHWGGRLLWQLENSDNLVVCWRETKEEPREIEKAILRNFVEEYGARPFANLTG